MMPKIGQRWKCKQLYDSDEYIFEIVDVQLYIVKGVIIQMLNPKDNVIRCGEKAFVHKSSCVGFSCTHNDCHDFGANTYVVLEYLDGQDSP